MKGIPVLVPVKEPKEGMKIVAYGKTIVNIKTIIDKYHCTFDPDICSMAYLSELQQIAIELHKPPPLAGRDSVKMHDNEEPIRVLLHPDDYEKVLPLIGQEVEVFIPMGSNQAELVEEDITPAPVVYTEEEVLRFVHHELRNALRCTEEYMNQFYSDNVLKYNLDWWNKHKKK